MKGKDFTTTITVAKSPEDVFKSLTHDVSKWWGGQDLQGKNTRPGDEFIIDHPGAHYSKQKLVEVIPGKKLVWLVTDSTLYWLKKDQHEWANTRMIFELSTKQDQTVLHFTHEGLVPEKECYTLCQQGWTMVIKDYLFKLINYDQPHFMDIPDYHVHLSIRTTAEQAVSGIGQVQAWWAQEMDGAAQKAGDEFTVHFGKTRASFRVEELTGEQIIWKVTDCYLDLLEDTREWNNTRLIFRLRTFGDLTLITITHEGLTSAKECFEDCKKGWDFYLKESLQPYLEKKHGLPGEGIHAWLKTAEQVYKGTLYSREQAVSRTTGNLLLLDVKKTKGEQVLSAHAVRPFTGSAVELAGAYYMLLPDEPGLLERLESFTHHND